MFLASDCRVAAIGLLAIMVQLCTGSVFYGGPTAASQSLTYNSLLVDDVESVGLYTPELAPFVQE